MNIQLYFKKPIKYLLTLLLVVCCFTSVTAQTTDWFKGSWYGVKNFSHGQIGKKALVRIEIDSQYKDHFSGRLIYMYPKDTIARMIRTFSGKISGKSVSINKSDELYLLDPRSRSFWSNCTQCDENGSFLLSDGELVLKVTTTGCGDSCDAETVFSRNINSYDSVAQADIQEMFGQNKEPVIIALKGSKKKIMSEKTDKKILVDSVKENLGTAIASTTKPVNNSGTVAATNVATPTIPDILKTNSKVDSTTAIADINSKQKNNKITIAKQILIDSGKNNNNPIAISKKSSNKNFKIDSTTATDNIDSKQKKNKITIAKQIPIDSSKNNNTTAISKKPLNKNLKIDSITATANINSKQNNNKITIAKQILIDSSKSNNNTIAISKKLSNKNLKVDSITAIANINSKQKNNKNPVAKQSHVDSAKNNKDMIAANIKPANASTSNQNNIVVKKVADTSQNLQPLSDSDVTANLKLIPAEIFMLADTVNVFVSRTDSVAMAKLHRETNLVNEYQVSDSHIQVELFDNGVIDSDAVSVYYNGRILFNNVVLTYKPIAFAIDASGANRHHEFTLIAENEGSIPPNTALLRITAGAQQYKLFVSTTLSKNAKIAIDYTGY